MRVLLSPSSFPLPTVQTVSFRFLGQVVDLEGQVEVKTRELFQLEAHLSAQERSLEAKQDELEEALKESQGQNEALCAKTAQLTNLLEEKSLALLDKVSKAWFSIGRID